MEFFFTLAEKNHTKNRSNTMDRKIEKKRFSWQKITLFVLGAGALAFLVSAIWRDAGTSRLNVETERLLLDTIHKGVFQEFIPITGVVQPIKTVYIAAVEGGRVEERFVEDGAMVTEGQPILQLSNPDLQMAYVNQEAQIVSQINQIRTTTLLSEQQSLSLREQMLNAEYQIDLLSKRVARNKKLHEDKVISDVEFQETEDEYESQLRREKMLAATMVKDSAYQKVQQQQMQTTLDLMERNLAFARQSLENLTIKAPIAGQLSGLDREVGELITEGANIAQIDVLTNFKIRARIDEFYISRVFLDQEGSFQLAGKWYNLRIKKIYPQVTNGAFEVDMVFTDEIPETIKRGQTVSIKLELSAEEQALLLARGGFYQTTGGNWVYVLDPKTGNAYKRTVRFNRQNPNFYEVVEGLQEGDIVITSSYENFGNKDELVLK